MSNECIVILTNWRRPLNLEQIVPAIRRQTVQPSAIACIDNADAEHALPQHIAEKFDIYLRAERPNYGPPCRFIPALSHYRSKYCLFLDDDMLPGYRVIETFLATAAKVSDRFATLCQIGRIFEHTTRRVPPWRYAPRNVPLSSKPIPVDMGCRAHFVLTRNLHHLIAFNWDLIDLYGEQALIETGRHDDMSLCLGLQRATLLPTLLLPENRDRSTWVNATELPAPDAISGTPMFRQIRSEFIDWAYNAGWRSLCQQASAVCAKK